MSPDLHAAASSYVDLPGEHAERSAIQEENGPPLIVSAAEFLAEEETSVESLWGDALLVPGGGYLIVSGEGGVGKTIVLAGLFVSLAAGRSEYLGFRLPGESVPVLVLEAEGSRPKFRERMKSIAASYGANLADLPIFFPAPGVPLAISELEPMIRKARARACLLDPIGRFHDGDENSSSEWRKHVTKPLGGFGAGLSTAFAFADHYTKPNENRRDRHKLRGSAAKIDDCGSAMRLEYGEAGKGARVLFFDRVRDGGIPDPDRLALSIDLARGFTAVDRTNVAQPVQDDPKRQEAERRAEERRVAASLRSQAALEEAMRVLQRKKGWDPIDGASVRQLATEAGVSRNHEPFRDAVAALVAQGAWETAPLGFRPKGITA